MTKNPFLIECEQNAPTEKWSAPLGLSPRVVRPGMHLQVEPVGPPSDGRTKAWRVRAVEMREDGAPSKSLVVEGNNLVKTMALAEQRLRVVLAGMYD